MKVLFAVDGSDGAAAAVRQAGQLLSDRTDAAALYFALPEVIVRHASATEAMAARARQAIADAAFAPAREGLPDDLARNAVLLTDEHTPRDGILRAAESWGADMVVVGARGLGTLDKLLLGSVSQGVVQQAKCPVLVVRPNPEHRRHQPLRVLITCDGSTSSAAALAAAERLSLPPGTEVTALAVVEAIAVAEMPDWILKKARDADSEAMARAWECEHENEKRRIREQTAACMAAQPAPFNRAEIVVAEGNAAEQILAEIDRRRVDLVIIGTHGSGLLKRLFLGSTSAKVLTHAPCSVLVVRG